MKTKAGFKLRPLASEFILAAEGTSLVDFNKMISMNKSAAYLWKSVDGRDSFTVQDLADLLLEEYEVDRETALKDAESLVQKWIEAKIVEE